MLQPFQWGSQGRKLTPEQVARERARADAMLQGVGDTSPVDHWLQGAGRVVNAISGKVQERRADASEELGLASADEYIANDPVLSALIGGRAGPTPALSSGGSAPVAGPNQDIANDTMAAIGQPATAPSPVSDGGGPMDIAARALGLNESDKAAALNDYLTTGGQNIDPATTAWCAAFVDATLRQSGMEGTGKLNARSYLDWGQPVDQPQRGDVAVFSRGDPNGWQGHVGFFDGYDEAGKIRVLGGNQGDAVSLASYDPSQLLGFRRAGEGGGMSASGQPVPITGGGGDVVGALAAAMSNPWVAQKYGPVIEALMDREMGRSDMQYQQQLAQADPMYQAQLNELLNPRQEMPASVQETQWRAQQLGLTPGTPEYQEFIRGSSGSAAPASFEALRLQALEAGLQPGTPEYQNFMLNGGGDPATFRALDMQARRAGFEPGTPEYQDFMATRGSGQQAFARTSGENAANIATGGQAAGAVAAGRIEGENTANAAANLSSNLAQADQAIGLINSIMEDPALPGITGMIQGRLPPMTQAGTDLNVKIKQLQGKAFLEAFESLKGGGAITEREGQAATEAMARLDRAQSTEEYIAALTELRDIMQTGADRARAGAGAPPPNDDGWTVINGVRVREKR